MNEARKLTDLIEYLKALAELKRQGIHVTLEITSTLEAIEEELRK
ncbi:hypothetical protein SAMN04487936_107206 [Halobacillus dabanensis]|uniref:Uncharacterized protein n=1 Tax=Halobacillus dabanensis TaxID=240302 RepID=A0A1I3WXY3_HALDA|nr:hypothetical protein [Halobacillus dabanensis]SFK12325.1 hypothetical protein SAMN04487936_107206 [Halobacillus dabanensis]